MSQLLWCFPDTTGTTGDAPFMGHDFLCLIYVVVWIAWHRRVNFGEREHSSLKPFVSESHRPHTVSVGFRGGDLRNNEIAQARLLQCPPLPLFRFPVAE